MIDPSILDDLLAGVDAPALLRAPARQPVHTVYVPADRFSAGTLAEWGSASLAALHEFGPLPGIDDAVQERVRAKLAAEPVEDLRVDFEDGYGLRPDDEEDAAALGAARALGAVAPASSGLRIKSFEARTRARSVRTLEVFLDALGTPPEGFRVTLPKVSSPRHVEAMLLLCDRLGAAVPFELQIETPRAVLGPDGSSPIAPMLVAAGQRCVGLVYGAYDYSAALGIAPAQQSMEHPAADHAKAVMLVAAAAAGVPVCDGSNNRLPVGDAGAVHAAWQLHLRLVRRSLDRGFYQGWDLHPAQLPARFAATYAFFRDGLDAALDRLAAYRTQADSGVLDEPATEHALVSYLRRAVDCGAVDPGEVAALLEID